jgi:hypothetical protein
MRRVTQRALALFAVTAFLFSTSSPHTHAAATVRILVDGKEVVSDPPAFIKDGRTFMGVRAIAEALGGQVQWDGETRQVYLAKASHRLVLKIGSPSARYETLIINRANRNRPPFLYRDILRLDVTPQIDPATNRAVLPFRAITEAFHCRTTWDGQTRTVAIDCSKDPVRKS